MHENPATMRLFYNLQPRAHCEIHRNIHAPLLFTLTEIQSAQKRVSARRSQMKRALFALVFAVATLIPAAAAHAQVRVAVGVAPVAVYATPCPGPGYIW